MAMERNNRTYQFNPNVGNDIGSFQEHDSQMREFRRSHANVALVNGTRMDEATFLESPMFLRINHVTETGGGRHSPTVQAFAKLERRLC